MVQNDSLLTRLSSSSLPEASDLTSFQRSIDQSVSSFARESTNMGALFAMSSASIAYRFGRIATLAMAPSTGSIAAFARGSSYLIGLASEVTAFEGVQGLMNQTPTITQNRWIDSFINFGVLKGFGRLAAEQNWLIRNLSSDLGMVAGHEIAYQSGFGSAPEGSFIERMAHAQVVNLQLAAGSSLVHRALPRIQQLERSLDLLLNTSHHSIEPPSQTNLFGQPLLAHSNGNHHTREDRGLKTNIGLLAQTFEHSSNGPIYSGGMRSSHRLPAARHSTPPNYTLETLKRLQSFDSDNIGLVMDAIRIVNHLAEEVHPNTTQEFIYEEARELLLLQASLRSSGSLPSLDKSQRFYEDTVRVAYLLSRPQELSSMVESLQNIPSMSNLQIARLKGLAENIAGHLGKEGQSLRQAIHTQPSRDNISLVESYLRDAQSRDPHHTPLLSQLKESLQTLREIYEGRLSLSDISQNMSVLLRESIVFPESKHPDLEEVQSLAINIRKLWNEKRDRMSVEDSIQLARLAGSLQRFAFSQCDFINTELHSERSTQKIATLITTLYGSGYGTDAWLQIAREFSEMRESRWEAWFDEIVDTSQGETLQLADAIKKGETPSIFRRFLMHGALAHEMILQVRDHYHDHFDPLLFRYKNDLGISEETRNLYTSELYRTMAIFQLGQHLQGAEISAPQRNRAQSVLKLIPLSPNPQSLVPYFFGQSNYPTDIRQMGGKGRGLHLLQGWYPNNTPLGFSLPARAADYKLSELDRRNISAAILHLETTSRRKLGTDLFVSVRSGSAISMPGTMKTTLNVGSTEELFRQVEEIYASWDSPIAKSYRLANGIPDELGTAVHIVQMVDGTKDERSGSGIALSFPQEASSVELANNNPDKRGTNEVKIVFGRQVRGEALVSGTHTGEDPLPTTQLQKELQKSIHELERHYGLVSGYGHAIPVEVEYTIESGKIYFLQIRRAHLTIEEEIRWFTNQVDSGQMTRYQAVRVLGGRNVLRQALHLNAVDTSQVPTQRLIASNMVSSGPPYVGRIAMTTEEADRFLQQGLQAIFVTSNPDVSTVARDVLKAGAAALVNHGNPLSHLSAIAKTVPNFTMMTGEFQINPGFLVFPNGRVVKKGSALTLDPLNGRVYEGELPIHEGESPVKKDILFLLGEN